MAIDDLVVLVVPDDGLSLVFVQVVALVVDVREEILVSLQFLLDELGVVFLDTSACRLQRRSDPRQPLEILTRVRERPCGLADRFVLVDDRLDLDMYFSPIQRRQVAVAGEDGLQIFVQGGDFVFESIQFRVERATLVGRVT